MRGLFSSAFIYRDFFFEVPPPVLRCLQFADLANYANPFEQTQNFDREVFIPIQNRFVGSGLIFLLGTQAIYYGMKFNGSARMGGPIWSFVSGLHDFIVFGVAVVVIGALVLFVGVPLFFVMIPDGKPKRTAPETETPLPKVTLTPEEIEKQRLEYERMMQKVRELHKQEQKRIEEKRLVEEQRKQEAMKARRERSAKDAAHAGLEDFL
jgi:hypothetical protein